MINEKRTLWGVIIIIIVCIIVYNMPLIIRLCENEIEPFVKEKLKSKEVKEHKIRKKEGLKHYDILEQPLSDVHQYDDDDIFLSMVPETSTKKRIEVPKDISDWIKEEFGNVFIKGFSILAASGDSTPKGKLNMLSKNDNGKLRKATKIIYYFPHDIKWSIRDGWVFKDYDKQLYYVPEENTAIIFNDDTLFEWTKRKNKDTLEYFVFYMFED